MGGKNKPKMGVVCQFFENWSAFKGTLRAFRKKMGTGFTFCLALNAGGQKKTVPIFF